MRPRRQPSLARPNSCPNSTVPSIWRQSSLCSTALTDLREFYLGLSSILDLSRAMSMSWTQKWFPNLCRSTSKCPINCLTVLLCRNKDGVAKNAEDIALLKKMCHELEQKTIEDEKLISELNINVTNLSMNEKLHYREACDNYEDRKLHFLIYLQLWFY